MLDWFRKLMMGDSSSVPPDAKVERDELGRVTQVEQTLTMRRDSGKDSLYPQLILDDTLASELASACDWLVAQNAWLVNSFGVGSETDYGFEQDDGSLTLHFEDGRKLIAEGQVLGTFDPRDGTFMWSWANSSIRSEIASHASRLKENNAGIEAFSSPRLSVKFEDLTELLALAARQSSADGLYRCFTSQSSSVFVAFKVSALRLANGEQKEPECFFAQRPSSEMIQNSRALVMAYGEGMLALDRSYHDFTSSREERSQLLKEKLIVHRRYWIASEDNYHEPCSFCWPSNHDPEESLFRITAPAVPGGVLDISIGKGFSTNIYRVDQQEDGTLKIVDCLLDWGKGLLWPKRNQARKKSTLDLDS